MSKSEQTQLTDAVCTGYYLLLFLPKKLSILANDPGKVCDKHGNYSFKSNGSPLHRPNTKKKRGQNLKAIESSCRTRPQVFR